MMPRKHSARLESLANQGNPDLSGFESGSHLNGPLDLDSVTAALEAMAAAGVPPELIPTVYPPDHFGPEEGTSNVGGFGV